ncbi:hypothetical protein GBA52_009630 [Prunus armeniaca]|nr:hypothetical protein GBA52_009630 [Prunus armeniaca]
MGRWHLYPILFKIKDCHRSFALCAWSWMRKSGNQVANHLASLALLRRSSETWKTIPPPSLISGWSGFP